MKLWKHYKKISLSNISKAVHLFSGKVPFWGTSQLQLLLILSLGKSGVDHVTVIVVSQHKTLFLFYFYLSPEWLEIPLGVIEPKCILMILCSLVWEAIISLELVHPYTCRIIQHNFLPKIFCCLNTKLKAYVCAQLCTDSLRPHGL